MALSNSRKVKLTKNIIASLEGEEWSIIDFTLKQFGFPVTDEWGGTKKAYLVEMLSEGEDANLVELAEHIESENPADATNPVATADTAYWHGDNLRVFISHLSDNKKQAAVLQESLAVYGMSCFVAHEDINPNAEWQSEIETALQTCELLIALVSLGFKDSNWCDQEIGWALGRGIPVFTIRWGADPHGFVSRFQGFPGKGKTPDEVAAAIFSATLAHKLLQKRVADMLVTMFVESPNWEASKRRIGHLQKLDHWEPSYSKRIAKAAVENYEISQSFGVPEKVKALVAKWKKAGVG